ncbi:MAG: peptidase S8, partial [Hymenobacter sp.]
MKNLRWLLLLTGVLGGLAAAPTARAQTVGVRRYFVYFRDKASSPYSVGQPQQFLSARALARRTRQGIAVKPRDLPVNPAYVAQVRAVAGSPQVLYTSRWLNGAALACDSVTLSRVLQLPSVQSGRPLSLQEPVAPPAVAAAAPTVPVAARPTGTRADYGRAWAQSQLIGAVAAHDAGFRGEGMQVAVFDAGFPGANTIGALQL